MFVLACHAGAILGEAPAAATEALRRYGRALGLAFQIVDDILDGDGYAVTHGGEGARKLADEAAARAHERLEQIAADTSTLGQIVAGLSTRTS